MGIKMASVHLTERQSETEDYKVAAASSDGIVVNQHFGRADTFYIYEAAGAGGYRFLETRKVTPVCDGGNHDEEKLRSNIEQFKDCRYLIASRIGGSAANRLEQFGVMPMELPGIMEESLDKVAIYEKLQHLF